MKADLPKRKVLTKAGRARVFLAFHGRCAGKGCDVVFPNVQSVFCWDHGVMRWLCEGPDDLRLEDESNFRPLCELGLAWGAGSANAPRFTTWQLPATVDGDTDDLMATLHRRLSRWLVEERIDILVSEAPMPLGAMGRARGAHTFVMAFGMKAIIGACASAACVPHYEMPPSEWRKHFLGRGDLKRDIAKQMAMEKCRRMGWDVMNDNEGDACGLWETCTVSLGIRGAESGTDLFIR